ncbi:MAG TPA: metallophosphoesterase [Actinomycetota bacterium]|jgi:3',5'-cyclic AMP phosphodiesterase CpdA|nr:metallophosphoesterase [Actinomycetota bacterium]
MSTDAQPLRIVQLSDIHCGEVTFDAKRMESIVQDVNELAPDLVIVVGDLTAAGYEWEFAEAADWLGQLEFPMVVVPGNHDARNVGYLHFEHYFGDRFSSHRIALHGGRAQHIGAPGVTVVAVDSSEPDLNEGQIGRERYPWIREQFTHPDDLKIFVIHHHLVAIPGTGRERNTINDAGDVLAELSQLGIDVVLSGHKHVPYFWGITGLLICNSGTATTKRLRGLTPSSWSELEVDAQSIKVYLHYENGRRELACVRSRGTRAMVREGFYITDEFLATNHLLPPRLP